MQETLLVKSEEKGNKKCQQTYLPEMFPRLKNILETVGPQKKYAD